MHKITLDKRTKFGLKEEISDNNILNDSYLL